MRNEIVPVMDPSETSNSMRCKTQGLGIAEDVQSRYLLDLSRPWNAQVMINLVGNNHQMRHFIKPDKGHKYVNQFRPTQASVKPLLDTMKEPSVLLLQGCDQLLLQADHFPSEKFKTLTALEISGISHLTSAPEAISQMTQLQSLTLSHLPIKQLPHHFFLSLTNLRSLALRVCYNLHSLPPFSEMAALHHLDFSYLPIKTLPKEGFFSDLKKLNSVILRGCSELCSLPSTSPLQELEVLDLSHCTALQQLQPMNNYIHPILKVLDLSHTTLNPTILDIESISSLIHLFIRNAKMSGFDSLICPYKLKVLNLSGAQNLRRIDQLQYNGYLVALDLSRTEIESIDFISDLIRLHSLLLKGCTRLVRLPKMKSLTNLEVLDISGCENLVELPEDLSSLSSLKELNLSGCINLRDLREGVFDQMTCLEKLDLSNTELTHPPSFVDHLSHRGSDGIDFIGSGLMSRTENLQELEGLQEINISKPNQLHLVSTFPTYSGFELFKDRFDSLVDLISNIQGSIIATTNIVNSTQPFKKHFRTMHADLKYILDSIDLLESSHNCMRSEELLHELMRCVYLLQDDESPRINELLQLVVKLKLLVPPPPKHAHGLEKEKKRKASRSSIGTDKDEVIAFDDVNSLKMMSIRNGYKSLTDIQKNCLLYFVVFPCNSKIKERTLIHLWYGEGFIDPTTYSDPKMSSTNTIEEIGHHILKVLRKKGLLDLYQQTQSCSMPPDVHAFVMKKAKEKSYFNLDPENGKLTPYITSSKRACLLRSQQNLLSSCKLWADYADSAENSKCFTTICTLFNLDEQIINIDEKWFSKMRNLSVLHLGSWDPLKEEQVDVVSLKFLDNLKNMKKMRLLNLEGLLAIVKLPDSICKLTSLKLLNLTDCSYLEELPVGIGALKNLTHLDLTRCHNLSKLPKGMRLLSRLEVLKGFVITYQIGGRQHREACTLRELLKLEKLRKLNLVVRTHRFPESEDLLVLNEMRNLGNLKITWEKNYNKGQESQDVVSLEPPRHSRWQQLKCWEQQQLTNRNDTKEELLRSSQLSNLKKLVLYCFPSETTPYWLHPSQLENLERLYIVGGNLENLSGGRNPYAWNVKFLRLKHLPNLSQDWNSENKVRDNFPKLKHLERYCCCHISKRANFWGYFH